ncbi:hypothetical protein VKT23_008987 [Stygiomarasmius scandens]|uniref:DUF6535 domain-containing protein n=1 Tax=Marasmiellus scandens TaxID=2682957 RepID=A0ABR1JIX2_9AGAR
MASPFASTSTSTPVALPSNPSPMDSAAVASENARSTSSTQQPRASVENSCEEIFNDSNQGEHARSPQPDANRSARKAEKKTQGPLPGMTEYQSTYSGNRDHDYEKKYPPDPIGGEVSDDARVWKVYLDEAERYDDEMLKGFQATIDTLLVFAALFSAVVTTFVIQTSQVLQPDYTQITAHLLLEQIQLLRAAGNVTAINEVPPSSLGLESTSFSTTDLWINGLFFASLSLSLAVALASVLVKQWLQYYNSPISGSTKDCALMRQSRFEGFSKWGLYFLLDWSFLSQNSICHSVGP